MHSPILLTFTLAALVAASPAGAQTAPPPPPAAVPDFVPGEVIIGFKDRSGSAERTQVTEDAGVEAGDSIGGDAR